MGILCLVFFFKLNLSVNVTFVCYHLIVFSCHYFLEVKINKYVVLAEVVSPCHFPMTFHGWYLHNFYIMYFYYLYLIFHVIELIINFNLFE